MKRWMVWGVVGLGLAITVTTLALGIRNGSFDRDPTIFVSIAMILGYVVVGSIVARRLPRNPIGWLMIVAGLGLLLGGFWTEYAVYALVTAPGRLPFGLAAAWLQTWSYAGVLVILVLLLFPTGNLPSRRWRPVFWGLVASTALLALGSAFRPGAIDITEEFQPANPLGIEALREPITVVFWVAGLALAALSVASVVALVLRLRRATGEERQQLRWLAFVGCLTAVFLVAVLLTSLWVSEGETTLANDLSFLLFLLCLGIGIPIAIAVALLRYHLYDLDLVLKKTVVFGVVAGAMTLVVVAILVLPLALLGTGLSEWERGLLLVGVGTGLLGGPLRRRGRRLADRLVYGQRATPYEVLSEFSERVGETYSADDILPRMAAVLGEGTGAEQATVWLNVAGTLRPAAVWPSSTAPPPSAPPDAVEVIHQGASLGTLSVTMPANDPMNPSKEKLVQDLAGQAGLVLRNVRLIQELRASRQRLVAAQDQERRRIERNIHDGAQQQLVALQVKQRLADQLIDRDTARAHELMAELQLDTATALDDLRDLARGIYPPLLADQGLTAALEAQARRSPVPVEVEPDGIGRYEPDVESTVYFCCLEALTNVAKYAEASRVTVTLSHLQGVLTFEVHDDGRGFDRAAATRGSGLQGMADRLDAIGGELFLESAPGEGTRVRGSVRAQAVAS